MKTGQLARGMIDAPLSDQGMAEADHLGARIRAKGGIDSIVSSTRKRAQQTKDAILHHNPNAVDLGSDPGFDPMAQGMVEAQPEDEASDALQFYGAHPDQPVPGVGVSGYQGESVNSVDQRTRSAYKRQLASMRPGERRLIVAHHTQMRWLDGLKKKGFASSDPHSMVSKGDKATPARTLIRLAKKGGKPFLHRDDIATDEPIRPGATTVRHGETELNSGGVLHRLRK